MKISVISSVYGSPWAGSEEFWFQTSLLCLKKGHDVYASLFEVADPCPQFVEFESAGGKIEFRKKIRGGRLRQIKIRLISSFRKTFKFQPDVLILSLGSLWDVCLHPDLQKDLKAYKGRLFVICLYNSDHYALTSSEREQIAGIMKKAELCVFVSDHNYRLAERQLAIKLNKVFIACSPVSYRNDYTMLPWPSTQQDTITMACVARLDVKTKGHDILLEALSGDKWKNRSWYLELYGTGADKDYISQLISHYNLDGRVNFSGVVADTREVWKKNQLLVMASRSEGLSLAVVEAMICGRVCVVTDVGGHADVITDSDSGFLATAATPKYFEQALDRAWQSRDKFQHIIRQAHDAGKQAFSDNPIEKLVKEIGADS